MMLSEVKKSKVENPQLHGALKGFFLCNGLGSNGDLLIICIIDAICPSRCCIISMT